MAGASILNLLVFCTNSVFGLSLVLNHYSKTSSTAWDSVPTVATARCADECFKTAACTEFSVETNGTCTHHGKRLLLWRTHWWATHASPAGEAWAVIANNASACCTQHGSYLATILTDKDQEKIETLTNATVLQMKRLWLGGMLTTRTLSNGTIGYISSWDNGEPWNYEHYAPGQPSGDGHCIQMMNTNRNFQWNDVDCESLQHFVCEK